MTKGLGFKILISMVIVLMQLAGCVESEDDSVGSDSDIESETKNSKVEDIESTNSATNENKTWRKEKRYYERPQLELVSCSNILINISNKGISAINPRDGSSLWSIGGGKSYRDYTCREKTLLVAYKDVIRSVDLKSGNLNWEYKTGNFRSISISSGINNVYFAGIEDEEDYLYSLNTEKKKISWRINIGKESFPTVSRIKKENRSIYLVYEMSIPSLGGKGGTEYFALERRGISKGRLKWRSKKTKETFQGKLRFNNESLYFKTTNEYSEVERGFEQDDLGDSYIYRMELRSGKLVWKERFEYTSEKGFGIRKGCLILYTGDIECRDVESGSNKWSIDVKTEGKTFRGFGVESNNAFILVDDGLRVFDVASRKQKHSEYIGSPDGYKFLNNSLVYYSSHKENGKGWLIVMRGSVI